MKTYENNTKRVWFDNKLRLWTLQHLDAEGNQVGNVDYSTSKETAFNWLTDLLNNSSKK